MVEVIKWMIGGGVVLTVTLLALIAAPSSKLRDAVMPFAYFGSAIACGLYVASPLDFAPEAVLGPLGCVDDLGAVAAGIASIRAAIRSHRQQKAA